MQSDYILRMIEQFVQALASIIRSRIVGNYDQAIEQIQMASHRYLSTDISSFIHYAPNQLLDHFRNDSQRLDTEHAIVCADLLGELALICEKKAILDVSLRLNILSLNLYLSVIPMDKQFQTKEYMEKTTGLIDKLDEQNIPEEVLDNLDQYHRYLAH